MANDSLLRVTLTADARPLTGVLRDSAQALDTFAGDAERSGRRFAAAMADSDRALETVNGHLQRLEGLGRAALGTLGELGASASGGAPGVGELNQRLEDMISAYGRVSAPLTEFADALPTQNARAETLSNTLRAVGGAAGGTAVLLEGYRVATLSASAATTIFNAVVRANPLVRIATLGAAAAGALYSLRDATVEVNGETLSLGDLATPVMRDLAHGATTVANTLARHLGPGVEKIADDIGELDFNTVVTQSAAAIDEALRLWGGFTEALSTAWDKFVITLGPRMVEQLNPVLAQMSDLANWKPFWLKGVLPDWDFDFTLEMPDEVETANAGRSLGEAFMTGYNMTAAFGPRATDYINNVVGDAATNRQLKQFQGVVEAIFSPVEKGADQLDALSDGVRHTGAAASRASREIQAQANALQALQDRLDPVAASQRAFQTDTQTLNRSVALGAITFDRYFDLVDNLQHAYRNSGDAAQTYGLDASRATQRVTQETSVLSRTLDQMVAGLDDTFQGFWQRLLGGAKTSFEGLKTQAISALAEIIHTYTTQRIVASLGLSVGGSLAGTGSALASGTGGGFGGSGLDLASLGKTLYQGITDGFGAIQWAGVPTGATAYTSGFGSQVATGGGMFGGSFQNFTGFNGMASLAAAYAGTQVGNKLGSSLFGKQANANLGATAGGAIGTFFGGSLGAFAGSTLGGMVDSLFGSHRDYKARFEGWATTPERHFGAGGTPYYSSGHYRNGDLGRGRETPFGSFGFTRKTKFEPSDMIDLLDALAALDQTLASGASAEQIETVRDALDGWSTKLHNDSLGKIITRRYAVITQALAQSASEVTASLIDRVGVINAKTAEKAVPQLAQALQLGNLIDGLGDSVRHYAVGVVSDTRRSMEDALAQITAGVGAHAAVSAISDQLNLSFDAMGERAVEAALNLQQLAGGLDALQSQAQRYYANFFSESERQQRAIAQLTPTLHRAGLSAYSTREQFRAVVESLDLNSAAGRQTYSELMGIADAFAAISDPIQATTQSLQDLQAAAQSQVETAKDAVRRAYETFAGQAFDQRITLLELAGREQAALSLQRQQELETLDASLRPIQQRIWALQDEQQTLAAARQASDDYRRALAQASSQLAQTLGSIGVWVDQQQASGGAPGPNLQAAQAQFARQLVKAQSGDRDALGGLTQYAERYQQAGAAYYGSGSGYQRIRGEIVAALGALPDQVSAEQYVAAEIKAALLTQTDGITTRLGEVLRGDNPASIASALAADFAALAGGIDGVLTRDQLRLVMNGKATDRQLDAMLRVLDLNGDAIVSGLESVVVAGMPSDAALANVLTAQLEANAARALTADEVRAALTPLASGAQIQALIAATDTNGNGLLSAQEIANARLGGLALGIGGALGPMFERIDASLDGLIDYPEFGKYFTGLASDAQLRQIFAQLDRDGDGQISALEAIKGATDRVDGNTGTLESRALDQLRQLTGLSAEMSRTTDQFITLNTTMQSLQEALVALGLAQQQAAEIEARRRAAEAAEKQRIAQERARTLAEQRKTLQGEIRSLQATYDGYQKVIAFNRDPNATGSSIRGGLAEHYKYHKNVRRGASSLDDLLSGDYDYRYRPGLSTSKRVRELLKGYNEAVQNSDSVAQQLTLLKQSLDRLPTYNIGGAFGGAEIITQPTLFNTALMGEAGPEAIMPLSRGADGSLGVRLDGAPAPVGGGGNRESAELAPLLERLARLTAENTELLRRIEAHEGAGVRVAQAGHQRSIDQLTRIADSNQALDDRARLEALA